MAEVDTMMLSQEHSDIRREVAAGFGETRYNLASGIDEVNDAVRVEGATTRTQSAAETNEIVKEGLKGDFAIRGDIKDTRHDISDVVGSAADRLQGDIVQGVAQLTDRFFTVGRDTMDLRAQVVAQQQQLAAGFAGVAKDTELAALKTQLDARANTTYLSDKISNDGEKTRALLNDLKYHDLNRALVERQTALVNSEQDNRLWHSRYNDARWDQHGSQWGGQFAAMQSQLQSMNQNFNSQLAETRQGMVNFGTMAGVGQSSTNNNVR